MRSTLKEKFILATPFLMWAFVIGFIIYDGWGDANRRLEALERIADALEAHAKDSK